MRRLIIVMFISIIENGLFSVFYFCTGSWRNTFIPLIVFPLALLIQIIAIISFPYCFRVTVDRFNRTISFCYKSLFPCMCNRTSKVFRMDDILNFTLVSLDGFRNYFIIQLNYKNGNPGEVVYEKLMKGEHPSYNSSNNAVYQLNMILRGEI